MNNLNRTSRGVTSSAVCEVLENRTLLSVSMLDPNFGSAGKVLGSTSAQYLPGAPVVDPYGRMLIAVGNTLVRYRANGSLDASFGSGGKVVIQPVVSGDVPPTIGGVAFQSDGEIVITFNEYAPGEGQQPKPKLITFSEPYVARLTSAGKFDTTFGTKGIVDVGALLVSSESFAPLATVGIAVLSTGKIVVGGDVGFESQAFQATRLTSTGKLDTTFGSGGLASMDIVNDYAVSFDVEPNGKIVIVGGEGTIVQFTSSGGHDLTFGSGGEVSENLQNINAYLQGAAVQANDQLIVVGQIETGSAGSGPSDFYIERLKTNGKLDTVFGSGGAVKTSFGAGLDASAMGVALQSNGEVVAAGYESNSGATSVNFAVARYLANGSPDTAFGTNGIVTTSFGGGNVNNSATGVAVESSGRIVVDGSYGPSSTPKLGIVRYLGNHAVITGGQSQITTGTSSVADPRLTGSVAKTQTLNFSYGSGSTAVHGQLQEWVEKETAGGTLDFYFRIVTSSGSVAGISSLIASNFAGYTTYVDYRPDSAGTIAPVTASRSGDSKSITFTFLANPPGNGLVTSGTSSYALFIKTNATTYNTLGKVLLNNVISLAGYEPT